jgi:glucokinase
MNYYLGFDVGGTNIVCGIVDDGGQVLAQSKHKTAAAQGSVKIAAKMAEMARKLVVKTGLSWNELAAAGVGVPGLVDPKEGTVVFSGNLSWRNVPIGKLLEKHLHLPVVVDNDVRMYVYGESLIGAGKDHHHVLGVIIGTGLAVAMVNNGALYYGNRSMAGELGHVPVGHDGYSCGCGGKDCLETFASASGLLRHVARMLDQGRTSLLADWKRERGNITAADISRAYDLGDPLAIELLDEAGEKLGKALAFAVSLLSPDVLIIGGGLSYAGDRLIAPMSRALENNVLPDFWNQLTISRAYYPEVAGVIGSALNARFKLRIS